MAKDEDDVMLVYDEKMRSTDEATLYRIDGEAIWLPHALIVDDDDTTVTIPEWLAVDRELV